MKGLWEWKEFWYNYFKPALAVIFSSSFNNNKRWKDPDSKEKYWKNCYNDDNGRDWNWNLVIWKRKQRYELSLYCLKKKLSY